MVFRQIFNKIMKSPTILNIDRSQDEYFDLLLQFEEYVQAADISVVKICALLDEVKCFWLKRLKPLEFELEEIAESQTCLVLAGAISLDASEYEHFFFKSLGDFHIIPDPFSKLEMIFRQPVDLINGTDTVKYFTEAFNNTIEILKTYKGYFYILPIQEIAAVDSQKHSELINMIFWKFVSSIFNDDFKNNNDFQKKFKSFEEMEAGLSNHVRDYLVFNDLRDRNLSIRKRIEKFSDQFKKISFGINNKSDAENFLLAIYSYIAQIGDILIVCSLLRLTPYIGSDITFTYFTLIMNVFTDDEDLRRMIERTLVCYLFYKTIDESRFENFTFSDYYTRLKNKSLLDSILKRIHTLEIDIFKEEAPKVVRIIEEEFESIV